MGVFARIFRRSKTSEETSTAEAQAGTTAAEPTEEAAADEQAAAAAKESAESEVTADEADETASAATSDGVEIPKQQSAGEAADSEADEGART